MRYAGIIENDCSAAPGICVTFFVQGCEQHCKGCHNPDTWDYNGGKEFTKETLETIDNLIKANGVQRNLCIMGGEPLSPENQAMTLSVIDYIKERNPEIKIYLWTGYKVEDLQFIGNIVIMKRILKNLTWLIDGPFEIDKRDITLPYRGSSNQRVIENPIDFI